MKEERTFKSMLKKYCGKGRYEGCSINGDSALAEKVNDFEFLKTLLHEHLDDIHDVRNKVGIKPFSVPRSALISSIYFGNEKRKTISVEYRAAADTWIMLWCPKISDLLDLDDFKARYLEKCIDERKADLEKKIEIEMTKLGELLEAQKKLEEL